MGARCPTCQRDRESSLHCLSRQWERSSEAYGSGTHKLLCLAHVSRALGPSSGAAHTCGLGVLGHGRSLQPAPMVDPSSSFKMALLQPQQREDWQAAPTSQQLPPEVPEMSSKHLQHSHPCRIPLQAFTHSHSHSHSRSAHPCWFPWSQYFLKQSTIILILQRQNCRFRKFK